MNMGRKTSLTKSLTDLQTLSAKTDTVTLLFITVKDQQVGLTFHLCLQKYINEIENITS